MAQECTSSDNRVDNYGWTSAQAPGSSAYITPEILTILKRLPVHRVADIGAGNGYLCSVLAAEGFQVVGLEYDQQGVEIARKNHPQIPFHRVDVGEDPKQLLLKEEPFDIAVSTEVVEHLFTPHQLPVYAHGILKDGGYLVLSTPYHGYWKNLFLALFHRWDSHHSPLWTGGHIKFWSRATLTQLLQENGFQVVDFAGVGRVPLLWKSMVLVAKRI